MPGPITSVLVVDDNAGVRAALSGFCRHQPDMRVCGEAADGTDAVKKASECKPDLILMDVVMPNLNGLQAAAAIRKLLPETRIVIFTMFGDVIGKSLAKAVGVDLVITKGTSTQSLIQQLQPLLEGPKQSS